GGGPADHQAAVVVADSCYHAATALSRSRVIYGQRSAERSASVPVRACRTRNRSGVQVVLGLPAVLLRHCLPAIGYVEHALIVDPAVDGASPGRRQIVRNRRSCRGRAGGTGWRIRDPDPLVGDGHPVAMELVPAAFVLDDTLRRWRRVRSWG